MKFSIKLFFVMALLVTSGAYVHAQEDTTTVEEETEIVVEDVVTIEEETTTEVTTEEEDVLTEEEITEIIENAEEVVSDNIDDLEDLEGEIIAITDDFVVIETEEGEIITVSIATYEQKTSRGSGNGKKAKVGEKIETGKVDTSGSNPTVTTKSGTYTISDNVVVTRNGKPASAKELNEGEKVAVVLDKDGSLISLDMLEEIEEASKTLAIGTIIAIILILLLALIFRKRKNVDLE